MRGITFRLALLAGLAGSAVGFHAWTFRAHSAAPQEKDSIRRVADTLYDGIRAETLDNGLRVYLKPVPGSPVVSTMVAYKVGAADEDLDQTGLSHYLEHLMFKGTEKLMPGDIDRHTLRNGGANNAYTSEDCTVYHFDFAADRWETALRIEADRMRNLRIDDKHEFQQEKGAVIEELQRNEDLPWDLESKAILPLLFGKTHPYGHPVIGERKHVREATAAIIKSHYDKWYHPNNAALVVCGGFDPDQVMTRIRELFGVLPRKDLPERKPLPPIGRDGPTTLEIASKFETPRLLLGFNGVRSSHADHYALEVLQGVISGGKTSRLYKKLVEGEAVAGSISSSNNSGRYPGWFSIQVELLKDKDRKKVEGLVLAELQKLRDEPVSAAELQRVQRGLLAAAIFQRESVHGLADNIARGVTTDDLDYLKNYLPRLSAVTAQDVQHVARTYLDLQRRVAVWSLPGKQPAGGGNTGGTEKKRAAGKAAKPGSAGFALKDSRRVVLDNGLTLLLYENHRLPIVVAEAQVRDIPLREPADKSGVAALTGRLLDEGTDKHTGPQIAEMIENVGGTLDLTANGGSIHVLAQDRGLGLQLLFECLAHAAFPRDAFAREKNILLAEIDDAETQPETRAQREFRALVYGKHPFGRPSLGRRNSVAPLTPDDCTRFHRQVFVPNNTEVALVGDFDTAQVIDEVKKLTADWKSAPLVKPTPLAVDKPIVFSEKILSMPEAAQLHFYLGHVGITRANPDFYKLLVMDYVLGTGPGFTDRLSARLRDREGLAYTVSANISSSAGEQPGVFTCYIGTDSENFDRVKQAFLEELHRIRNELPTAEEVEDVKKYLLGSQPFQFTTNKRIAEQLLFVERHQLGADYLDHYRQAITAVTPDDVRAAARKYLDPKRMVLVAAGAIDKNGKVQMK